MITRGEYSIFNHGKAFLTCVIFQIDPNHHKQEDVERGLGLFFQLMSNKTFLLIFIRTLESSKNFQLRDRVNVASLVTVALQTKMEYSTEYVHTFDTLGEMENFFLFNDALNTFYLRSYGAILVHTCWW